MNGNHAGTRSGISKTQIGAVLALSGWMLSASAIQFEETTSSAGIIYTGESWGTSWGDVNGDGRPDLYTNNHRVKDSIWVNNGNGTFTDAANAIVGALWDSEWNSDTHGATLVDFDNDGDKDLVVSNGFNGRNTFGYGWRFFVNQNGTLVNQTEQMGLTYTASSGGRFPGWFDVNNDGKLDLWVLSQSTGRDAELFIQKSTGGFTNTTSTYQHCRSNHFMMLSDLDLDGRLEVLCSGKNDFPNRVYDTSPYPLAFRDETASVPFTALVQDTALMDFNNDLRPDIFHVRGGKRLTGASRVGPNNVEAQLIAENSHEVGMSFVTSGVLSVISHWEYRKDTETTQVYIGSGGIHPSSFNFTLKPTNSSTWGIKPHDPSVASQRGIYIGYTPATQTWQFFVSPGGKWNLTSFQVASTTSISHLLSVGLQAADRPIKPALYSNTPGGFVVEDLKLAGLNTALMCVGVAAGDFDNDRDVDLYLVCREASANIANVLYENQGNAKFVKVANAGGAAGVIGSAQGSGAGTGEEATVADYDGDGFLDLFVSNGLNETEQRTGGPYQLFHNKGNANHWVELDLQGGASNRDGIGAKVIATTPDQAQQLREQNGGFHRWSQDHSRLHFGLASHTSVDLRIEWPSGAVDTFFGVAANHIYRVVEQGAISVADTPPLPPSPFTLTPTTIAFGNLAINTVSDPRVVAFTNTSGSSLT